MDFKKFIAAFMMFLIIGFPICSAAELVSYYQTFSVADGTSFSSSDPSFSSSSNSIGTFNVMFDNYANGNTFKISGIPIPPTTQSCDNTSKICELDIPMSAFTNTFSPKISMFTPSGQETYFIAPQLLMDNDGPSFITSKSNETTTIGRNVTFEFTTYEPYISYLQINDEFLQLNKTGIPGSNTGIYSYSVNFDPINYVSPGYNPGDDLSFTIALYDKVGNKGNSAVFTVFMDNSPPQESSLIVGENYIKGPALLINGNYYDISINDQLKPVTTIPSPKIVMCFIDDNKINSIWGNFSALSTSSQSKVIGTCSVDKNVCQDDNSYKCTFDVQILKSSMCDQNGCGKSFYVNVTDTFGNSQMVNDLTTFNSQFFDGNPPGMKNIEFYIDGSPAYDQSSTFYFYQAPVNTLIVTFDPTDAEGQKIAQVIASKSNIPTANATSLGAVWNLTKIDDVTFALNNFTFNKNCGNACNISISYENNLGVSASTSFDAKNHLDFDSPQVTSISYNLINSSNSPDFILFGTNVYYSKKSIPVLRVDVKDNGTGFDNTTVFLLLNGKSINGSYIPITVGQINSIGYYLFPDISSDFSQISSSKLEVSDLAGNNEEIQLNDLLSSSKIIEDADPPVILNITKIYYAPEGDPLSQFINQGLFVTSDAGVTVAFALNVSESKSTDSGFYFAYANVSQICRSSGLLSFNQNCVNDTSGNYYCQTIMCNVDSLINGEVNVSVTVFDKSGLSSEQNIGVFVKNSDSKSTYDCLKEVATPLAQTINLPQRWFWTNPPLLVHTYTVGLKQGSNCPLSSDNLTLLFLAPIQCQIIGSNQDLSSTAKLVESSVSYDNNDFSFDASFMYQKLSSFDSSFYTKTGMTVQCNTTVALSDNSKIYYDGINGESLNFVQNYSFVDLSKLGNSADIGQLDDTYVNEIKNIENNYAKMNGPGSGFWKTVDALQDISDAASVYCKIGNTISTALGVIDSVFGILGVLSNVPYLKWLDPISKKALGVSENIKFYLVGGSSIAEKNGIKNEDSIYANLIGWKGQSGLGKIACSLANCGGSGGLLGVSKLGDNPTCRWWTETIGSQEGNSYFQDMNSYQISKNSWISSAFCLCLPGLIYKLDQIRQINCKKAYCLKYETVAYGGMPPSFCEADYVKDTCNLVIGGEIDLVMQKLGASQLLSGWKDAFNNPMGSFISGYKRSAQAFDKYGNFLGNPVQCETDMTNGLGFNKKGLKMISNPIQFFTALGSCMLSRTDKTVGFIMIATVGIIEVWEDVLYYNQQFQVKDYFTTDMSYDYCRALIGTNPQSIFGGGKITNSNTTNNSTDPAFKPDGKLMTREDYAQKNLPEPYDQWLLDAAVRLQHNQDVGNGVTEIDNSDKITKIENQLLSIGYSDDTTDIDKEINNRLVALYPTQYVVNQGSVEYDPTIAGSEIYQEQHHPAGTVQTAPSVIYQITNRDGSISYVTKDSKGEEYNYNNGKWVDSGIAPSDDAWNELLFNGHGTTYAPSIGVGTSTTPSQGVVVQQSPATPQGSTGGTTAPVTNPILGAQINDNTKTTNNEYPIISASGSTIGYIDNKNNLYDANNNPIQGSYDPTTRIVTTNNPVLSGLTLGASSSSVTGTTGTQTQTQTTPTGSTLDLMLANSQGEGKILGVKYDLSTSNNAEKNLAKYHLSPGDIGINEYGETRIILTGTDGSIIGAMDISTAGAKLKVLDINTGEFTYCGSGASNCPPGIVSAATVLANKICPNCKDKADAVKTLTDAGKMAQTYMWEEAGKEAAYKALQNLGINVEQKDIYLQDQLFGNSGMTSWHKSMDAAFQSNALGKAVYDAMNNGVGSWVCEQLGFNSVSPLSQNMTSQEKDILDSYLNGKYRSYQPTTFGFPRAEANVLLVKYVPIGDAMEWTNDTYYQAEITIKPYIEDWNYSIYFVTDSGIKIPTNPIRNNVYLLANDTGSTDNYFTTIQKWNKTISDLLGNISKICINVHNGPITGYTIKTISEKCSEDESGNEGYITFNVTDANEAKTVTIEGSTSSTQAQAPSSSTQADCSSLTPEELNILGINSSNCQS